MQYEDWTPVEKEIIGNEVHYKLKMVQPLPEPVYINPDEKMFPDSHRPRDEHGFPIQPGRQKPKWDMRGSLKNTYLDQVEFMGSVYTKGIETNSQIKPTIINFWEPKLKVGKLWWRATDWMITIPTNWNYMLQVYGMFIYPQGHDNNLIKNCILTLRIRKKWESEVGEVHSAHRSCISPDTFSYNTFEILKAGDCIGLWVSHSFAWENVQIIGWITILKLS